MPKGYLISDMTKERLDNILTEKGYFETKSRAQAAIMAGDVKINDVIITKAGYQIELKENTVIEVKSMPFVSRGGFKLDKAIKDFNIDLNGRVCLDAGASTGGFTDCMLQNGARKVYAVDVGYGQIAWKLRTDNRVKVIERVNVKNCEETEIYETGEEKADFLTMDLSFISITKVLPNLIKLANREHFEIISLIKPQFEAGKDKVGKNGIIKEKETHIEVIKNIIDFCKTITLYPHNLTYSPIKGQKGNIEYLIRLLNEPCGEIIDVEDVVKHSHEET